MLTDPAYRIIHTAAAAAVSAAVVFFGTYLCRLWQLRQLGRLRRYRGPLRLASVVAAGVALCVVLFVTSPLDYRASAPAPAGLKLYVLSASNDLFTLRASDGAQTFVRHLPGPQLQMVYHEGGLLILVGPGQDVPAATATAGTAGTAAGASSGAFSPVSTYTLQAVRGDDGQAVLPALAALTHVTADTLDHGTLYVSAIADPAHPDVETLSAFSLQAGALLWRLSLPTPAPAPAPTPMPPQFCGSDGGALYVLVGTSLSAVRTGDGAILWRSAPLTRIATVRTGDGAVLWRSAPLLLSSPSQSTSALRCVAQDGGVYLVVGDGSDADPQALIKLNERDGTLLWNVPAASIASVAGDRLYVIRNRYAGYAGLVVLRASDGAQLGAPLAIQISAPVNAPHAPYSTSSAGILYVLGRSTAPAEYTPSPCEVFAIRLRDGARLWQRPPHACDSPRALRVAGGILYYTTYDGDVIAFRAADGSVLWTRTGYSRGGWFFHWSDSFAIGGFSSGVLFVYASHDVPCRFLVVGCDPDNGQYLEALNPATGALYWRYRSDQVSGYVLSVGT